MNFFSSEQKGGFKKMTGKTVEMAENAYQSLSYEKQDERESFLMSVMGQNFMHICSSCANKYFGLPKNFDFEKEKFRISEDYDITMNFFSSKQKCELGVCQNVACYTVHLTEE